MLSLSVLAARSRLLRAPAAARAASAVAHCIGGNASVISTRFEPKSRAFSAFDGPKDDEDKAEQDVAPEQPMNGELSPLERLMQHSQQFELEIDDKAEENEPEEAENGPVEAEEEDDDDDEPFGSNWQPYTDNNNSSRSPAENKRNPFRRRGISDRQSKLGMMATSHLVGKDMDELDYEAELENVWNEDELKERKFHQALRREMDRDHVCTNCGERGHRSRNCLVPRICPYCGGLGHAADQCRYKGAPKSIDEFLKKEEVYQEKRKQSRKLRKTAARAAKNPHMPRPKEVPTSDFNKRNESLRKELDAELDAYADLLEERAKKRKAVQAEKESQSDEGN